MLVMCPYCQGALVYGNFYDDDKEEGEIVRAVGTPTISIMESPNGEWFLGFSDGIPVDDDPNKCEWISIGEPINYCPHCGIKFKKKS